MVLELDKAEEASLTSQAKRRGLSAEELAVQLVRAGLQESPATTVSDEEQKRRGDLIDKMIRDRKGRTLGLNAMSAKEFAHLGHKY